MSKKKQEPQLWKTEDEQEEELEEELKKKTIPELIDRIKWMRRATNALPRWMYLKLFLYLADILMFLSLSAVMIQQNTRYTWTVVPVMIFQVFLLGDSFVTVYKMMRIARGETR